MQAGGFCAIWNCYKQNQQWLGKAGKIGAISTQIGEVKGEGAVNNAPKGASISEGALAGAAWSSVPLTGVHVLNRALGPSTRALPEVRNEWANAAANVGLSCNEFRNTKTGRLNAEPQEAQRFTMFEDLGSCITY